MTRCLFGIAAVVLISLCSSFDPAYSPATAQDSLIYGQEKHFKNLRQLTFGGDNAEAYWSFDNTRLVFQSNNPAWGLQCDQIFYTSIEGSDLKNTKPQMLSTGD